MDHVSRFTYHASRAWRARAPLRLDIAGGWTDVAPFSAEEGGAVCGVAVRRYQVATFVPAVEGVRLASGDEQVSAASLDELPGRRGTAMLAAALRRKGLTESYELRVESDAPPGSGLGSSGALGVTLLGLLNAVRGERQEPHEVALEAQRLEVDDLGVPGGLQDQFSAALGGFLFMDFAAGPRVKTERLQVTQAHADLLAGRLVLCYGGRARLSGDIIDAVMGAYRAGRPQTCAALRGMKTLAFEARAALEGGDLAALGEILAANWEAQKDLHPSVSNPELERLFELASGAGATGGKALGAGGGGCLVFYCPEGRATQVAAALEAVGAQIWPVEFDYSGLVVGPLDQGETASDVRGASGIE